MNDAQILELCLTGDKAAFNTLLNKYQKLIENVALGILRNREAMQDAAQEVRYRIYRKISTFQGKCCLSTWIYRITVNECYRYLEKFGSNRTCSLESLEEIPADEIGSLNQAIDGERIEMVQRLLKELDPDYRKVLTLYYYMDMKVADIAKNLNVPQGTVASRINRAREAIRERMDESVAMCA